MNGGGQIKARKGENAKDLLARVEAIYFQSEPSDPQQNKQGHLNSKYNW